MKCKVFIYSVDYIPMYEYVPMSLVNSYTLSILKYFIFKLHYLLF